jgi:A/G-specific adenine glycosylase
MAALRTIKSAFQKNLIDWFIRNRRDLPWRKNRTPYRVWVSELMLQQTRVDQATGYYLRFMKKFPDIHALAKASRHDVLKMWEGLGYYSRAVRAHETAQFLVKERGGNFPGNYAELLALPGIGPYTAAAIASLAFGLDHAVLDGNVIRVLARVYAFPDETDAPSARKDLQAKINDLLPVGRAADFNEAVMELGALVCTPARPDCERCPLSRVCEAYQKGTATEYPVRKAKKSIPHRHVGAGVIVDEKRRVLIARRHEKAMLGGLWEFPGGGVEKNESIPECIKRELLEELAITVDVGPHLVTVRHTFSHFRMDLHAHWVRVKSGKPKAIGCSAWKWVPVNKIADYALPRADQKILAALLSVKTWPVF